MAALASKGAASLYTPARDVWGALNAPPVGSGALSGYRAFLPPSAVRWRGICYDDLAVCVSATLMYCTQTTGLQSGESPVMIVSVSWTQYINVTDRQTDKQTDTSP